MIAKAATLCQLNKLTRVSSASSSTRKGYYTWYQISYSYSSNSSYQPPCMWIIVHVSVDRDQLNRKLSFKCPPHARNPVSHQLQWQWRQTSYSYLFQLGGIVTNETSCSCSSNSSDESCGVFSCQCKQRLTEYGWHPSKWQSSMSSNDQISASQIAAEIHGLQLMSAFDTTRHDTSSGT
jgi:hypothetical protein